MGNTERLRPEALMRYHLAHSVLEKLAAKGGLSAAEKNKLKTALDKRHGFSCRSIFTI